MALLGVDEARGALSTAANSYAKIQKEIDKYNKIFEVYSQASPETQARAASVMRQAINEYNGLKKQQEENTAKIYQAQQWITSYNKTTPQAVQQSQADIAQPIITGGLTATPAIVQIEEEIPVIDAATPGVINNNTPTVNVEVVKATPMATVNAVKTPSPATVGIVNYYQAPKNVVPKANIATQSSSANINWSNYGPGSVASMSGTGGVATLNTVPKYTTSRKDSLTNTLNNYIRTGAKYIYNYLRK